MPNCKVCHTVSMIPHDELLFWYKCPSCGYSEVDQQSKDKYPKADLHAHRNLEKIAADIIHQEWLEKQKNYQKW